jgi:hypothetical protein
MRRLLLAALAALVLVPGSAAGPRPVPAFKHVLVIVFENKERSSVLGSAPAFDALGSRYAQLEGYQGVTHPSLPNYLARLGLDAGHHLELHRLHLRRSEPRRHA